MGFREDIARYKGLPVPPPTKVPASFRTSVPAAKPATAPPAPPVPALSQPDKPKTPEALSVSDKPLFRPLAPDFWAKMLQEEQERQEKLAEEDYYDPYEDYGWGGSFFEQQAKNEAEQRQIAERKPVVFLPTKAGQIKEITLSEDQEVARNAVLKAITNGQTRMVLTGPAGSGKTTLMRTLISDLEVLGRPVTLLAPTGKAATRLAELTGRETSTIHRPLYRKVVEDSSGQLHFSDSQAVAGYKAVVIVDEASMLGTKVFGDLTYTLPKGAQLLCVGDREQLEPVNDTWGPDFTNPTAALSKVHRQALESPILALATDVRNGKFWRNFVCPPDKKGYERIRRIGLPDVVEWLVKRREAGEDTVLVTYMNRTRQMLNYLIRERYNRKLPIEVGDRIVCKRNNADLGCWNGEIRVVQAVEIDHDRGGCADVKWTDGTGALIVPWLLQEQNGGDRDSFRIALHMIGQEFKSEIMQAEYGECLTIHSAQGSQWKNVGIVHDFDYLQQKDAALYRRLMYTAITRAVENLVIFEV